jgi:hypothetical protein
MCGPECLAERGKLLARFPNLADAKVVLVAETDVEQASGSGPIPGLFERVVDGVVLASRHVGSWKSDNDAHGDLLGGIVEDLTLWARRGVPNVCCATLGLDLLSDYIQHYIDRSSSAGSSMFRSTIPSRWR